jgi:hypothetical protein
MVAVTVTVNGTGPEAEGWTEREIVPGFAVTVTVAVPDFVLSSLLVAVTVTVSALLAGVRLPFASIVPSLVLQVTDGSKLPVPVTVAVQADAPTPASVEAGLQETETPVMVGPGGVTVTVAVPDFVLSSLLVAVTVTVPAVPGAVRLPLASIVPPVVVHVTA